MSKKSPIPQARHHVMIYDEDWDFLLQAYGPETPSKIGPGSAIKVIVHHHIKSIRAKVDALRDSNPVQEEKIEL